MAEENQLLTILDGETETQALQRWWDKNGLDPIKAQEARKLEYERQRLEALAKSNEYHRV